MVRFIKRFWLIILLSLLAFLLLIFRMTSDEALIPGVVSVDPASGSVIKSDEDIRIVFDGDVSSLEEDINILVVPNVSLNRDVQSNSITIRMSGEELKDKVFLEIQYNGIQLYSWSYQIEPFVSPTPSFVLSPTSALTGTLSPTPQAELGDPDAVGKMVEDTLEKYPLIKYMPYSSDNFAINYLEPLELGVKIKGADVEAIKQEALQWIEDKGVDPSTHEIIWL